MKYLSVLIMLLLICCSSSTSEWKELFDGKSLSGWDGDPKFWSVKNGVIHGETTKDKVTKGNTFAIYTGENKDKNPVEFSDFEVKVQYKILAHNSGFQYRSFKLPGDNDGWRVGGYQADFDYDNKWAGTNYGEKYRDILAKRGEKAEITGAEMSKGKWKRLVATRNVEQIGDPAELAKAIKKDEWNEMHVIAKGNHMVQKINGVVMSEIIDNDMKGRRMSGLFAIQLHQGPPMVIQVRSVKVKEL